MARKSKAKVHHDEVRGILKPEDFGAQGDMAPITPPDLDGDGKPGGSLSQLAWDCAEVAWAAVYRWSLLKGLEEIPHWEMLGDADRLVWAIAASEVIDGIDRLSFEDDRWEASVRGKIFAAVVRSIAL